MGMGLVKHRGALGGKKAESPPPAAALEGDDDEASIAERFDSRGPLTGPPGPPVQASVVEFVPAKAPGSTKRTFRGAPRVLKICKRAGGGEPICAALRVRRINRRDSRRPQGSPRDTDHRSNLSPRVVDMVRPDSISKPLPATTSRVMRSVPVQFMADMGRDIVENRAKDLCGTILMSDLIGFSQWAEHETSSSVMEMLNCWFMCVDNILIAMRDTHACVPHFVETIGDCILLSTGVPDPDPDHAKNMVDFALNLRSAVESNQTFFSTNFGYHLRIRIGVNSGEISSCVVRPLNNYRVFGHTVNWASRMESSAPVGDRGNPIQISAETKALLPAGRYVLEQRAVDTIKWHIDEGIETYLVKGFGGRRRSTFKPGARSNRSRSRRRLSSAASKIQILVVDDSVTTLMLFKRALSGDDFHVHTAKNGMEAVDLASDNDIDLALVDIMMPIMDGFTTAQRMRSSERQRSHAEKRRMVLIGMTSDEVDQHHRRRSKKAGMDTVWHKVFDGDDLKNACRVLVRENSVGRGSKRLPTISSPAKLRVSMSC